MEGLLNALGVMAVLLTGAGVCWVADKLFYRGRDTKMTFVLLGLVVVGIIAGLVWLQGDQPTSGPSDPDLYYGRR